MLRKSSYTFDENATYLIAGGFWGLGRSAARWMVRHGARHLILVSRSGPKTEAAKELLVELRTSGVHIEMPIWDVSSAESLSAALQKCEAMPIVKGCIQATMVLKVILIPCT